MIKIYERTMFIENLTDVNVKLYVYENSKYSGNIGEEKEVNYTGLKLGALLMVMMQQLLKLKQMEVVLMRIMNIWY